MAADRGHTRRPGRDMGRLVNRPSNKGYILVADEEDCCFYNRQRCHALPARHRIQACLVPIAWWEKFIRYVFILWHKLSSIGVPSKHISIRLSLNIVSERKVPSPHLPFLLKF